MCFCKSTLKAYLKQTHPISTMKMMLCRKYSFQKLTPFSHGNNVLDAAACNIEGFLSRDTCVCSTLLKRANWSKQSNSPH
jgi:hypothetical protein